MKRLAVCLLAALALPITSRAQDAGPPPGIEDAGMTLDAGAGSAEDRGGSPDAGVAGDGAPDGGVAAEGSVAAAPDPGPGAGDSELADTSRPDAGAQGATAPVAEADAGAAPSPVQTAETWEDAPWDEEALKRLEAEEFTYEFTVHAPRLDLKRVAGSANEISEEQLEQFEYQDIQRVLEKVPGIYARGEDGYGLRPNIGLRGASADRSAKVTLMEDGILFAPAPYSAPQAYYFPFMNRMVGVDIYKGPASIRFGPNTVGGAINLRTRGIPEEGHSGLVDAAAGLEPFGRVHGAWGYGADRFGVLVEGIHARSGGFKELDGGGPTGFAKTETMLKARYGTGPDAEIPQKLTLKLGYANEDSHETYLGLSEADFALTPYRRYAASALDHMQWDRTQVQLGYLVSPSEDVDLQVTAYRHDFHRAWQKVNRFRSGPALASILEQPEVGQSAVYTSILRGEVDSLSPGTALILGTNDRRYVAQGIVAEGVIRPGGEVISHLIRAGTRIHYDRIERNHTEDAFLMAGGHLEAEGTPTRYSVRNLGATTAFAAWASDELLWEKLLVAPGVRVEVYETRFRNRLNGDEGRNLDVALLPGVGAVYSLGDWFSVLAGVHRGFSPASPAPDAGEEGAASPEYSVNYEAGGRFSNEGSRAELIGFFNDYSNLTGECTFSSGCTESLLNRQFNAGRVHVYGLEAGAGHDFQLGKGVTLALNGVYTLTFTRFLTGFRSANPQFGNVEEGDQLPYVPVHQGALTALLGGEKWSVAVSVSAVGEMREVAGQGPIEEQDRVPARAVVDLSGSYSPIEGGEIYATVENALNTPYLASRRPYGARPGRPLFAQLGFRHRF